MAGIVTTQTTRVTAADAAHAASWKEIGGGQSSSQNSDVVIQGQESRARRVSNAVRGFTYDNALGIDLSAAGTHVGLWIQTFQPGSLSLGGIEVILGGADLPTTAPWSGWTASTALNYPAGGGWVRVWLDPTRTRDAGSGTLDLASVRQFGAEFDMTAVSGNAQNCMVDAIDYTAGGLAVTAGTAPSPAAFADFVSFDEGSNGNRFGVVSSREGVVFCLARLTIGSAVATVFTDADFLLIFAKQSLVAPTFMGVTVDLQSASTAVTWSGGVIRSGGSTNRGDLIVTGSAGTLEATGTSLDNLRAVTLTPGCTLSGCTINGSGQVAAGGASLDGSRVSKSTAPAALLWDVATDTLGKLDGMDFSSGGSGHAIELGPNCPATIGLSGQTYTGYGADGTTDAVLYNNSGKAVTVNVSGGGQTPTVRDGAGASTTVVNAVTVRVTVTDAVSTGPVSGARVFLKRVSDESVILNALSNGSGVVEDNGFNFSADVAVTGYVRKATGSPIYKQAPLSGTIRSSGFDVVAPMILDE